MDSGIASVGIIRRLFTEIDNQTWCPVRLFGIGFAIGVSTVYLVLACWTVVVLKQPFDYVSFGTGAASVWGTVAAAIVFKQGAETFSARRAQISGSDGPGS